MSLSVALVHAVVVGDGRDIRLAQQLYHNVTFAFGVKIPDVQIKKNNNSIQTAKALSGIVSHCAND